MPLFLSVHRLQLQSLSAKGTKGALAAGQNDDLHIAGLPVQRVEHPLDPVVIGKDQRVVQDHRRDASRTVRLDTSGRV